MDSAYMVLKGLVRIDELYLFTRQIISVEPIWEEPDWCELRTTDGRARKINMSPMKLIEAITLMGVL